MKDLFKFLIRSFNQMGQLNKGDMPELTNFLKTNPGFQSLSWKIFHFKNDLIKKLDEKILN